MKYAAKKIPLTKVKVSDSKRGKVWINNKNRNNEEEENGTQLSAGNTKTYTIAKKKLLG